MPRKLTKSGTCGRSNTTLDRFERELSEMLSERERERTQRILEILEQEIQSEVSHEVSRPLDVMVTRRIVERWRPPSLQFSWIDDLSAEVDVPVSTTARIVKDLERCGYVRQVRFLEIELYTSFVPTLKSLSLFQK